MATIPPCVPAHCGKDFRQTLHKPSPVYGTTKTTTKFRLVPAFTIQAMQNNTRVIQPPNSNIAAPQAAKPSLFKACYHRGHIPVTIEFTSRGKRLGWKVAVEKLDFHHYLPMFFDGLTEAKYPYNFIVGQGIHDMITRGTYKILPVVPQLILPLKNAFDTKQPPVLLHALKCLQMIVTGCDKVGEALVPYYRQILPVLNLFVLRRNNRNSGIDTPLTGCELVGNMIEDTLQILERFGGPDAFINIKYNIPTYESCVQN